MTDIVGVGRPEDKVLSLSAALETGSSHPLAVAILARAKADKVPVPPAAAPGVTGLWPAILADTGATVMVTLNAMRLLAWKAR